ncbi:hypothetical protein LS633_14215 [Pseudomonas sp. NIBR-H-19]|uniref:hypothetical protein n=1 Tax=Pseudomonas sp. NIBR-H-19 TaxID=2901380 RepID=UPI001E5E4455|nr:hypothetical protein [Pseudomonas sp. NIBR-H-19]UHC84903.1 hypothetical protein LS633_14215 [Pseudomonas sp. NIBR-H-19]
MKHSAIAGLFIAGALLTSPVFAADKDLCVGNLQIIKDFETSQPALSENTDDNIKAAREKAEMAQKAGNDKECVAITSNVVTKIQTRNPENK